MQAVLMNEKTPAIETGHAAPPDPARLWAEFGPSLRAFLRRRVPAGVDADDLVQDVFLRVIRRLATLRSTDRPEAWLFQIARNGLRDALRARLRRDGRTDALDGDVAAAPDPAADRAAEAELAPCLTGFINRLPEPYRTAITLTSLQGWSQADAARHLGLSNSGMKSRVQRARAQLRDLLVTCCAIAIDARGGVADFHVREAGGCAPDSGATACGSGGCGARAAASGESDDRLQG